MTLYGGIEAGGTKWVCAVGTAPGEHSSATIRTTTPEETISAAVDFFRNERPIAALGIGCFGPVDLAAGRITTTPKPGWANVPVRGEIHRRIGVPVAFDTDVNAAALGEHRWGAGRGLDTFCYVTVGTGIGGGAVVGGRIHHGVAHPEFGHVRIPHDRERDPFDGVCPYHGDCWEGLASAPALRARCGRPPEEVDEPDAWELEAHYLALGLVAAVCVLSPQRIVLGGGVMKRDGLREQVRDELQRLVGDYVQTPDVVAPALAPHSGVLGAIALAESRA